MGNSTRCYSIIERLTEKGVTVDVMTSENGMVFFSNKQGKQIDRLIETQNLYYYPNNQASTLEEAEDFPQHKVINFYRQVIQKGAP